MSSKGIRSRGFSLLLVLVLLLATFSTALAQAKPFCGDMDKADCALLTSAAENMKEVSSYRADAEYSAQLVGIPGLPISDASVTVTVSGAFTYDDAAIAAAQAMDMATGQEEIATLMAESPEVFVDFYNGWAFDMTILVEANEEVVAALSADAGMELPAELKIPLILKDGILYVDVTDLAPLMQGGENMQGWIGFELGRLMEASIEQGAFEQAAAAMDPESMAMMSGGDGATAAALMGMQAALSDPKALEKFMSIQRVDDREVDGATLAIFETDFDVLAFISSPDFVEMVKGMAASGALGEDVPSAADLDEAMQMMGLMGPMLFQGLTARSAIGVSIDEPTYVHEYTSLFSWDLSGLLQMTAMSGAIPANEMPSGKSLIEFSTSVMNSDFAGEQTISAPADAQIVPAEAMMQPAESN